MRHKLVVAGTAGLLGLMYFFTNNPTKTMDKIEVLLSNLEKTKDKDDIPNSALRHLEEAQSSLRQIITSGEPYEKVRARDLLQRAQAQQQRFDREAAAAKAARVEDLARSRT